MTSGLAPRAAALAAFALAAVAAAAPLPLRLDTDEAARIERGEVVIREVRDSRALALTAPGESADRLRSRIAALRPNYLSEVMFSAPSREGAIESLAHALADVKGYVGIKYWSKRNNWNYDLFDKMEIVARKTVEGGEEIDVLQHMNPFPEFGCRYSYRSFSSPTGEGPELFFDCENTSPISYDGISAVTTGRMTWMLYAFPTEGRIVFYGVGAVRAFDLFGAVRDRLKASFLGRIDAFFGYMSARLAGGPEPPSTEEQK